MTAREYGPLRLREKLGYGVGDLGGTLFFQTTLLYLIYFYTDVVGIAPAAVGSILLVARMIDAAANPVIGALADRTRSRWGRFRPYLLFGAIPLALSLVAVFSTVPGDAHAKQIYAMVSYSVFSLSFATIAIPYSALMVAITANPEDRTMLGTLRAGFSFTAGILVSLVTLPIVQAAGGGLPGFHAAIGLFALVGTVLLWITFATTREQLPKARLEAPKLTESLHALTTRPMSLFVGIFLLNNMSIMLKSAGALYYFKYNLGREDLLSPFLTFGAVMTVVGIVVTPLLGRRIGRRNVMVVAQALMALGHVMLSVLPNGVMTTFAWLGFCASLGFGFAAATVWPLLADCVDHIEWRSGKRIEGVAYGVTIFAQKLSLALGGALTGWMLSMAGYVPNAAQSASAIHGIAALVGYIPAIATLSGLACALLFPLTRRRVQEITAALQSRMPSASPNQPDAT